MRKIILFMLIILSIIIILKKSMSTEPENEVWLYDDKGYKEALILNEVSHKPIFIYVHTQWCKYCKKFDNGLLLNPLVQESLSGFIKVDINPEHSAKAKLLTNAMGVRGYPSLRIKMNKQSEPQFIKGPFIETRNGWKSMSPEQFSSMLNSFTKGER